MVADTRFTISCATCIHRASSECDECVVTFVLGREPDDAIIIDADEERAIRMLAGVGLIPRLRHEERAG